MATIAERKVTSSPPSTAIVFASRNDAGALDPLDAVRLEERGDAAGHLLRRPPAFHSFARGEVELRLGDGDAELAERVARLVEEVRRLHPGLRRDAPDAEARAAELRLLLDADDLRAELRRADRGGVPARAAAQDGDVTVHLSPSARSRVKRC